MMSDSQYTNDELVALQRRDQVDQAAKARPCFRQCAICKHCRDYSAQFAECRDCYPDDPERREILGEWEHCNCFNLPWRDRVGSQWRENVKGVATATNARAAEQAKRPVIEEAERPQRQQEDLQQLADITAHYDKKRST